MKPEYPRGEEIPLRLCTYCGMHYIGSHDPLACRDRLKEKYDEALLLLSKAVSKLLRITRWEGKT